LSGSETRRVISANAPKPGGKVIMATLIVSRPLRGAEAMPLLCRIMVDGKCAMSIVPGTSVEIELSPGQHTIQAKARLLGSRTLAIDAKPEGEHHFTVGANWSGCNRSMIVGTLSGFVLLLGALLFIPPGLLTALVLSGWGIVEHVPLLLIMILPPVTALSFLWNYGLRLEEVPTFDLMDQPILENSRPQPLRLRVTIRGMMILVAILAIIFWAGLESTRSERRNYFRRKANMHAELERIFRDDQQRRISLAVPLEKRGEDATIFRRSEAKAVARADHHAAMKRKYELAASQGVFTVDPDPPLPVWP
jgi:hypothetical protein